MPPIRFRSAPDPEAPSLTLPPGELLARRLELLGVLAVPGLRGLTLHANRSVMLSYGANGILRIHEGYAEAPDYVLEAVVRFLLPGIPRPMRKVAETTFLAFPIEHRSEPRRRPERPQPGDLELLHRLGELHARLNAEYFGGALGPIAFRLSGRMRSRLGELAVDLKTGRPSEIALGRGHVRRHGWAEVEHTVLHEMVHQWQAENGHPVDHGAGFRKKAREVGITPSARRRLGRAERKAG
ncbi:MAG TPA: SprT-like domain-containing protein [Gemmatimonadales bacterium]|nr:SprT-like domain-containing protein [Gemmatimonadales bacterium]